MAKEAKKLYREMWPKRRNRNIRRNVDQSSSFNCETPYSRMTPQKQSTSPLSNFVGQRGFFPEHQPLTHMSLTPALSTPQGFYNATCPDMAGNVSCGIRTLYQDSLVSSSEYVSLQHQYQDQNIQNGRAKWF